LTNCATTFSLEDTPTAGPVHYGTDVVLNVNADKTFNLVYEVSTIMTKKLYIKAELTSSG